MNNFLHKTRILCLLISILIINLGCAHHLPPLSEEVSANLGTIGVCTSSHYAHLYFSTKPVTDWGEGCDRGVKVFIGNPGEWALAFIEFPPAIILLPIILLIGTPIACIVGGLSTESESEVQEAEALLRNAISDLNIQDTFQYHFLRIAREKTPYIILPLEDIEFDDIKEKLNYSSLADKGVDTVFWIDISKIGLVTGKTSGINPSLRFTMSCSIELIRATDGEVVYRHIWEKKCDDDEFVDWADNYAEPFRKEFNRCCKSVAEQIVEDMFLTEPRTSGYTGRPFKVSAPLEGEAIVYFYRPSERFGGVVTPTILDNDLYVINLDNGKYIEYVVNPGKHEFRTDTLNIDEPLTFKIEQGETHFLRLNLKRGTWQSTWMFSRPDPKQALKEIQNCNEQKIPGKIEPKIEPKIEVIVNPNEPWTGTWKVTGGPWGGFVLKLKQSGNMVKSIRGSDHDIKAKVKGDRLKGWYGDTAQIHIDFKFSEDCTLFKGKGSWYQGTFYLKGERQE